MMSSVVHVDHDATQEKKDDTRIVENATQIAGLIVLARPPTLTHTAVTVCPIVAGTAHVAHQLAFVKQLGDWAAHQLMHRCANRIQCKIGNETAFSTCF